MAAHAFCKLESYTTVAVEQGSREWSLLWCLTAAQIQSWNWFPILQEPPISPTLSQHFVRQWEQHGLWGQNVTSSNPASISSGPMTQIAQASLSPRWDDSVACVPPSFPEFPRGFKLQSNWLDNVPIPSCFPSPYQAAILWPVLSGSSKYTIHMEILTLGQLCGKSKRKQWF